MIDYNLISESLDFYETEGFHRVETPWTVSEYIENLTKPKGVQGFQLKHNDKCLVASGEQSFLYQYLKGFLPKGRFQTVTPCFRYENFDAMHTKYFIKNELIVTDNVTQETLNEVLQIALRFYQQYIPHAKIVNYGESYDIEIWGKELGSFGIREFEFIKYIYGTGCAEPRLSKLTKLHGISYTNDKEG